jgi:hypothetical protein
LFLSTANNNLRILVCCLPLLFVVSVGSSAGQEGEDFCCIRLATFVPIPMPSEQEYDASGMISAAWYSALREFKILDCPIEYEQLSWEGRAELDKLIEDIGKVAGAESDPQAREAFNKLLDIEFIWKGTLVLDHIDEIKPGYWEEGYLGKENYVPGEAYGQWTLRMRFINVHYDEVVREGQTSWTGSSSGSESGRVVKDLARSVFSPVDDIIYDYEHIPWSCEVEPEEDEISVGDDMSITIKDIKDSQGRDPKPWQRIVVKVEKGEITNGTKLEEEGCYAFLVGDGEVEVEYEAPENCKDSGTEEVTIYNSCDWGQEWVRPLRVTGKKKEIGGGEFEITCDWEGTIESTFETHSRGDDSLISSILLDEGEFEGKTNWKMDVVFKLNRGNERVKVYELKSARFGLTEEVEGELELEEKGRKVTISGTDKSKVRGRELSPSECNLELTINLERKKYKIEGLIRVANIPTEGKGRLKIDVEELQRDERDSERGTEEYSEEVLIEGKFAEEFPAVLEGTKDEIQETPPEFQEFLKDIAGEVSGKIRWKLERKGEH